MVIIKCDRCGKEVTPDKSAIVVRCYEKVFSYEEKKAEWELCKECGIVLARFLRTKVPEQPDAVRL